MGRKTYKVIGVMSGTSLDGIDLACCDFSVNAKGTWDYKFRNTETICYPDHWIVLLKEAIGYSAFKLQDLDTRYTKFLAETISNFIMRNQIEDLDAICSHGHTIRHEPGKGVTLQIGNLKTLATLTGKKVVCDFRIQDVFLWGEGAPLVPIGDQLLFNEYDYCLNLGGFANISYRENDSRRAYDICPVNIVLNHYAGKLGLAFDENGKRASSGRLNQGLFIELNKLEYYCMEPPKSLGLEWVRDKFFPVIDEMEVPVEDILNTVVEHIAEQITDRLKKGSRVLITGGGTYNDFLISRMKNLKRIEWIIPSEQLIEYKEALIFGLMGILKLRGENNCLASVTGAKYDHSSGMIFNA